MNRQQQETERTLIKLVIPRISYRLSTRSLTKPRAMAKVKAKQGVPYRLHSAGSWREIRDRIIGLDQDVTEQNL